MGDDFSEKIGANISDFQVGQLSEVGFLCKNEGAIWMQMFSLQFSENTSAFGLIFN